MRWRVPIGCVDVAETHGFGCRRVHAHALLPLCSSRNERGRERESKAEGREEEGRGREGQSERGKRDGERRDAGHLARRRPKGTGEVGPCTSQPCGGGTASCFCDCRRGNRVRRQESRGKGRDRAEGERCWTAAVIAPAAVASAAVSQAWLGNGGASRFRRELRSRALVANSSASVLGDSFLPPCFVRAWWNASWRRPWPAIYSRARVTVRRFRQGRALAAKGSLPAAMAAILMLEFIWIFP